MTDNQPTQPETPEVTAASTAPSIGEIIFQRSGDQVSHLLERTGLRERADSETEELERLLLHQFAHHTIGDDEAATDSLEVKRAFLRHRFILPVKAYEKGDRYYGSLDTILNLTSIASGVTAALVAALEAPKAYTIVLGVVIAACQTFSQWLKPSQRAAHRGRAASELRSEAWDLLQQRDRYRGKGAERAWSIFCDQVDKVEDREESAEDKETSQMPSSSLGGNGSGDSR
jgi:hypothetical protein